MEHISSKKKYLDVGHVDYLEPLWFLRLTCYYRRQKQMQMKVSKSETYCSVGETKKTEDFRMGKYGSLAYFLFSLKSQQKEGLWNVEKRSQLYITYIWFFGILISYKGKCELYKIDISSIFIICFNTIYVSGQPFLTLLVLTTGHPKIHKAWFLSLRWRCSEGGNKITPWWNIEENKSKTKMLCKSRGRLT